MNCALVVLRLAARLVRTHSASTLVHDDEFNPESSKQPFLKYNEVLLPLGMSIQL